MLRWYGSPHDHNNSEQDQSCLIFRCLRCYTSPRYIYFRRAPARYFPSTESGSGHILGQRVQASTPIFMMKSTSAKLMPFSGLAFSRIRVPELGELVVSEEDSFIHGRLLIAISDQGTVLERRNDPTAVRKWWCNDVKRMLRVLQATDTIWVDFKPDNMLVDDDDNIWLNDFG